jgi:2-keto-4-pentenoate hydratase/2-oxohepta-3-ene-1,7-dioic acid hydratase in catechol pathway
VDGGACIGLVKDGEIWNLRETCSAYLLDSERTPHHRHIAERLVPDDMTLFIRLHHGRMSLFDGMIDAAAAERERYAEMAGRTLVRSLDEVRLLPPVPAPGKVVCAGNSYAAYLVDQGLSEEEWPKDVKISFFKPQSALIGHGETIRFPADSEQWDYETELSIVIGRTCRDLLPGQARDHIFGYTILNDACVRDIPRWTGRLDSPRGKAVDTFAPLGPWITPATHLEGDPNDLRLRTIVDDEVRQDDRTSGLLWPVERIVAFMSRYIQLLPGDVISTGSPQGNALISGKWLRAGQRIRCEIEGIGVLENLIGERSWNDALPPLKK